VGNQLGWVYALDAAGVSQITATTASMTKPIRSTPAIAYIADDQGNLDRWVFISARTGGGRLLAFKTDR
jgi:hypothetical protein